MKIPVFTGVCTALVTPFWDNKVNYPLVQQLLRRQIDAGVDAVVLAGTTGEAPTLSDSEKIELFRRSKNFAGDRCKIIAGSGSNSTKHAIELSQAAEQAGVDALLVVSPYYNKTNPEGLYIHYATIARSVQIPIIVYNVPSRTGVDIPVSVYKQLSLIPNIVGVKEASPDITKQLRTHALCGRNFHVWSGNDDQIVPSMALGGLGVISVLSNVCPVETVAMTQAALAGDFDTAADLQCQLSPLIELLFSDVNPIPVKFAMGCIGFDCGGCRPPLCDPGVDLQQRIMRYFK
ncbi:MAG: 4-hydroxy-tetrahydrodipicolinate synthase [Oscillospiraceae bacterium]|nr:4-hydroxy-tetrahydrodipicolinate synthase [Oscillospiraceae bacterium]